VKELLKLTGHELMAKFAAKELAPSDFFALQLRFYGASRRRDVRA
jgi:hypothetical protein